MEKQKEIVRVLETLKESQKGKRKTTLNREAKNYTPFQTLISCILSLRARDEITEKVAEKLFAVANTPEKIIKLKDAQLEKLIYSSGYYRNKAKTIKHISQVILNDYNGKVPNSEQELLKIKGIGRKTANIVLAFSFNKKVIPIDTHCHRIPNRLGWIKTKNPDETELELMKIVPEKYWNEFNGLFVMFGRTICTPISPKCSECPIKNYCKRINVTSSR